MFGCWLCTSITHEWREADFIPALIAFAVGNATVFIGVMALAVANSQPADVVSVPAYSGIINSDRTNHSS